MALAAPVRHAAARDTLALPFRVPPKDVFTIREVAELSGMKETFVEEQFDAGIDLAGFKFNGGAGKRHSKRIPRTWAVAFLVRKVREFPGEVSILALGPQTNLALALRRDPEFAALAKEIVIMGGSFNPQAANNEFALEYAHTPRLEFNFRWDPEAADAVLRAPWRKIVLCPVDPTTKTLFKPELIKRIAAADTVVARYVTRHLEGFPMWDELSAAVWLEPGIVTHRATMAVGVDTGTDGAGYGSTLSWPAGQGPGRGERDMEVVFEVDVPALERLVVDRLTRTPPAR